MSKKPLEGKVALVTGSARNIGRAIALQLAEQGAKIVVNAVTDQAAADAVVAEIKGMGSDAIAHLTDVTDAKGVKAMVDAGVKAFGSVDILILNASSRGQVPFLQMTHEQYRRVIDISLDGAFFCAQACLPLMQAKNWGRIVTLGGISWHIGTSTRVHNLVSKSGLAGFTRGLAVEFAPDGVTVNCVSPGFIDTVRPESAGARPTLKVHPPIDRMGTSDEIASMVRYLCLPEAAYITGQIMHVNGGMYLGGS
ncbi:MAG: 3-oxoacyl-ACP reductase FabG [Proteobacteria bacterium]|nr:3-oxoacyl-ACP reductase FabG [Pseudomonadota bacterium]